MSEAFPVGRVFLVGAGPGAPGLVTLRAQELIKSAEVLVYDYLCNPELVGWAPGPAEKIYAGKSGSSHTLTQDQINALLVARARTGKRVVRLKGGDPYVFGRGGEEAQVLVAAGISFEVVPGVTSAIAAPSYAGIPVTHRDFASTVTFVTGHEDPTKPGSAIDWRSLATLRGTKVFLMGVERIRHIADALMREGAAPGTPVALVRWGTTPRQETLVGTLATIADLVVEKKFRPPAVTIVGEVVGLRTELNWFDALPLRGQRVVVTRTRQQASILTKKLQLLGADVLEIPTIRIVSLPLAKERRAQLRALPQHFDWLVFTSPHGVELFFQEFFRLHSDLRALGPVKIAVVGPATAKKIEQFHLRVEVQPEIYTAHNLASALSRHLTSATRVCLPQGRLADPDFAAQLRATGATVDDWVIYDTVPEENDFAGTRARFGKEGVDWILFTSSSTVENWHALKLESPADAHRPRVISMGPVTSDTLRKLGYEIAAQSPDSTIESLVETIGRLCVEFRHGND